MGGKTGTTNLMVDGVYSEDFGKRITYFLAAPIDDPLYSIYLFLDQPKEEITSTDSAYYSVKLVQDILHYQGYGQGSVDESQIVEVPLLAGHSPESALEYLSDIGLGIIYKNYDSLDEEAVVLEQFPQAGESVLRGANVLVNFGADMSGLYTHPPRKGLYETYIPEGTILPRREEGARQDEHSEEEGGD